MVSILLYQIDLYSPVSDWFLFSCIRFISVLLYQNDFYSPVSDWFIFSCIRLVSTILYQIGVYSAVSDWFLFSCIRLVFILLYQIGFYSPVLDYFLSSCIRLVYILLYQTFTALPNLFCSVMFLKQTILIYIQKKEEGGGHSTIILEFPKMSLTLQNGIMQCTFFAPGVGHYYFFQRTKTSAKIFFHISQTYLQNFTFFRENEFCER